MLKFCCEMMAKNVKSKTVFYDLRFDEIGIYNRGSLFHSYTTINYCPWCGQKLPSTEEIVEKWFEELEQLGFEDPRNDDIPQKYKTDEWRRKNESAE